MTLQTKVKKGLAIIIALAAYGASHAQGVAALQKPVTNLSR
jgi:hypothetical protein